jgi:hypothetical protein
MDEDPDFSTKLDRSDVQRFMVDALDLLAITRRGRMTDAGDGDRWMALQVTARNRHEAMVQQLLEVDTCDRDEQTDLHYAARNGDEKMVGLLLHQGGSGRRERCGWTDGAPLRGLQRAKAVVRLLLDTRDMDGRTTLQVAAFDGNEAVVRLLLEKGAVVDAEDGKRRTALHKAARNGHESVVQLLLGKGAAINGRDQGR